MALALNVFRTVTKVVPTSAVGIYTAPVGTMFVIVLNTLSANAILLISS